MARYTGPVCRLCRRYGEKLYLKGDRCFSPKCAFVKRPTGRAQSHSTVGQAAGPEAAAGRFS